MVGQLVMAGMDGIEPSADLLDEVRSGRIGGIILYGYNISSDLPATVGRLQRAASEGGNPPLLISVDQEGGTIRRFPDGPPDVVPPNLNDVGQAQAQGRATGQYLARQGVNVNLAPVADVAVSDSFLVGQERGFRGSNSQVASLAGAFAQGLQEAHVAATAKHFPGVGSLTTDSDTALQSVAASDTELRDGLMPFQQLISDDVGLVMVANAVYPSLDPTTPAGFSKPIIGGLLRDRLGFDGVVITDALDSPEGLGGSAGARAMRAVTAGADIVLFKPPGDGPAAFDALVQGAHRGDLSRRELERSYQRVLALKEKVAR